MADGKVVYEIRGDNSKFQSDVNQTENIARSKQSAIGGFAKTVLGGIGAAVVAVGAGIVAFGKDAVGVGSKFDAAMSQVAATMGVTADEIGNLRDFAMETAATSAFSANEVAQGLNFMALAGYDAETSMKMLPNVLNLAAAGNMSLARASDMVTDAQSALGLSLEETTQLVDKMAMTSSKSNTSVEQLGDAMLTVGGTAKVLAGGTTELATMLGVLADNGIKGAEGGTALRNVILALSAPTDQAAAALESLGVSAYDANGNLRALPEVFADLNAAMDGMTQGEKTEILNTIFNKVDLKSANALLATSADRFGELSAAIDGATGAAEKMAATQLDNLAGDVTLFKSALEGAKITLSNSLTPALRTFVQFGTAEIGKLDKAFQKGGINGLASQLGKSLGDAVKMLVKQVPVFTQAAAKIALALVSSLISTVSSNAGSIVRAGISMIKELATGLVKQIPSLFGSIGSLIGEAITNIPNLLQLGLDLFKGLVGGIFLGIPELAKGVANGFKGLFSDPISDEVYEARKHLDDLKDSLKDVGKETQEMRDSFADIDGDYAMAEHWLKIFDELKNKTSLTKAEEILLKKAVEELNAILPETAQIVQDETGHWQGNTEAIQANIEMMKARAKAEVYFDKIKADYQEIARLEAEVADEYATLQDLYATRDSISPRLYELNDLLQDFVDNIKTAQDLTNWDAGTASMKAFAESVGVTKDNFTDWNSVMEVASLEQQKLQAEMKNTNDSIAVHEETINTAKDGIKALEDEIDSFSSKAASAISEAETVGKQMAHGVEAGIRSGTGAVAAAAKGLIDAAIARMKATAMIASPSKKTRKEIGQQIGQGEVLGLEDKIPDVKKASEKLINSIDLDVPSMDIPSVMMQGESDTRINAIISVLNRYLPRIGADIVLDTGELVGATVDKFDYELGVLQQRRARYE